MAQAGGNGGSFGGNGGGGWNGGNGGGGWNGGFNGGDGFGHHGGGDWSNMFGFNLSEIFSKNKENHENEI